MAGPSHPLHRTCDATDGPARYTGPYRVSRPVSGSFGAEVPSQGRCLCDSTYDAISLTSTPTLLIASEVSTRQEEMC
jgi:hypothetical protein